MNFTLFFHAMFSCIGSHRRLLRFLGVTEPLLELEFERRLVEKVKQFLLELGQGFTYIGNQHVLSYNGKDYKVDMLFFHRGLRLLVTVDLGMRRLLSHPVHSLPMNSRSATRQSMHSAPKRRIKRSIIFLRSFQLEFHV